MVSDYKINYDDILAFVSDNVSYMKKCFKDILKPLFTNCHHVTCVAHILALVGECWRVNLKDVDAFISYTKQIFSKCASRRRRWLQHLKNNNVENPVITRWNTWFKAAIYHAKYYELYQSFISNERCFEDDTQTLESLDLLIEKSENLHAEVNDNFV